MTDKTIKAINAMNAELDRIGTQIEAILAWTPPHIPPIEPDVTIEYDPETGLTWVTINGPVTNCTRCNRMLAGAEPFLCETCAADDDAALAMGAYG